MCSLARSCQPSRCRTHNLGDERYADSALAEDHPNPRSFDHILQPVCFLKHSGFVLKTTCGGPHRLFPIFQ